jgi:two-component system response regulator
MNILLIEDNHVEHLLLRETLKLQGIDARIEFIDDGIKALQLMRGERALEGFQMPDVIILDINLPGYNGIELLEKAQSFNCMKGIPIYILSNSYSSIDKTVSIKLGVKGFFTKPMDYGEYSEILKAIIQGRNE